MLVVYHSISDVRPKLHSGLNISRLIVVASLAFFPTSLCTFIAARPMLCFLLCLQMSSWLLIASGIFRPRVRWYLDVWRRRELSYQEEPRVMFVGWWPIFVCQISRGKESFIIAFFLSASSSSGLHIPTGRPRCRDHPWDGRILGDSPDVGGLGELHLRNHGLHLDIPSLEAHVRLALNL